MKYHLAALSLSLFFFFQTTRNPRVYEIQQSSMHTIYTYDWRQELPYFTSKINSAAQKQHTPRRKDKRPSSRLQIIAHVFGLHQHFSVQRLDSAINSTNVTEDEGSEATKSLPSMACTPSSLVCREGVYHSCRSTSHRPKKYSPQMYLNLCLQHGSCLFYKHSCEISTQRFQTLYLKARKKTLLTEQGSIHITRC